MNYSVEREAAERLAALYEQPFGGNRADDSGSP